MIYEKFAPLLGDWGEKLRPFIESEEMDKIYTRLKADSNEGRVICPQSINTYRAFEKCSFKDLKVVVMAMDPYPHYYNRTHVADGLAFSCSITDKAQPSLSILYEAIEDDVYKGFDLHHQKVNDLSYLAEQGVLLLNSSLTVEVNKVGSHTELWKLFMKYLIEEVLNPYTKGLIYVMMGQKAQYFSPLILPFNNYVLEVEHPAYAARRERKMIHNKVFSQVNHILKDNNKEEIQWLKPVKD